MQKTENAGGRVMEPACQMQNINKTDPQINNMEKNNNLYSKKKDKAIDVLKSFIPKSNTDVKIIIETILACYTEADIDDEKGIKVKVPSNQSNEVKFLIEELKSFIDGIKK